MSSRHVLTQPGSPAADRGRRWHVRTTAESGCVAVGSALVLRATCGRLRVGECFLHGRSYVAIAMYNGYNSTATTKPWLCRGPACRERYGGGAIIWGASCIVP